MSSPAIVGAEAAGVNDWLEARGVGLEAAPQRPAVEAGVPSPGGSGFSRPDDRRMRARASVAPRGSRVRDPLAVWDYFLGERTRFVRRPSSGRVKEWHIEQS